MRRFSPAVLGVLAVFLLTLSSGVKPQPSGRLVNDFPAFTPLAPPLNERAVLLAAYGRLPLGFERNQGQSDPRVQFLSRGHGYTMFLTANEAVLALGKVNASRSDSALAKLHPAVPSFIRMRLVRPSASAAATGVDELPGKSNYFLGNDPAKWRSNVANYARVKYSGIYPGIDLVYYGQQGELEYDFVVAPNADPRVIQLQLDGSEQRSVRIDATGTLVAETAAGQVRFHKPVIYQITGPSGKRTIIEGAYRLSAANLVSFDVSAYDKSKELVIDPVLVYSSFLGGTGADGHDSVSVAFDTSGNAYVASGTVSTDFPVTAGVFQPTFGGSPAICDQGTLFCGDAFVTKINAAGTAILYSTYLGGSDSDYAYGLAVDSAGNAYVAGLTKSTNFPVTAGVFQPTFGGSPSPCDDYLCGDTFVTKLNSTGSALIYSSYLGGSGNEHPEGLVIDSLGNAYVAGETGSTDFPTTPGAFQTQLKGTDTCGGRSGDTVLCHNAYLTKVNPTGTKLVFSTYLGGSSGDGAGGVAVDSTGRASVVGNTCSADFPVTARAFQPAYAGGCDIFVSAFNAAGSQLLYSTYFGGTSYEATYSAAQDPAGNIYLSGFTQSTDLPVTAGAAQTTYGGNGDALVAKFNPRLSGAASLVYSTYLGGSQIDFGAAIAVDAQGNAYTVGDTSSTDFPVVNSLQAARHGASDTFLTKLNPQGSAILVSTYLGGSGDQNTDNVAVDSAGNIYLAGWTGSGDFPTTPRAFQPAFGGGPTDIFVAKISPNSAAGVSFTPAALTFGPQAVGTTSPAQTVILHDVGSAALLVSSITTTGNFAQTNNCASSVAGGGSCAVSVSFTPTVGGARSGALSVTDNAGGSPQKMRLTGTGK